jgi:23S rRNA-/tRNA-specific pseudouridylate synthase
MLLLLSNQSRAWILSTRAGPSSRWQRTFQRTAPQTVSSTCATFWSQQAKSHPSDRRLRSKRYVASVPTKAVEENQWRGDWKASDFATHLVAGTDSPTIGQAIASVLDLPSTSDANEVEDIFPVDPSAKLSAVDLLHVGAVWFAPAGVPLTSGAKPTRLTRANATKILNEGDYLRIHQNPRRFPDVYKYTWDEFHPTITDKNGYKPGVIIDRKPNFLIIDKPANVPVHPTVDNAIENVAHIIQMTRNGGYSTTPQRLDQNTSGLFVVATTKTFASYFAKLLSNKTHDYLDTDKVTVTSDQTIHKRYRCLVCLKEDPNDPSWSVASAVAQLKSYDVLRHYLEPSIRAPKNFARVPGNSTWAESLMRIVTVGEPCALVGSPSAEALKSALWIDSMPELVVGVVELEVELLTGRTHQIRGQFCAEGFPLVGDAQYGGAIPVPGYTEFVPSEQLALQCCELEFLDPDVSVVKYDGTEGSTPSDRWNRYRLDRSWWTPVIETFRQSAATDLTTSSADLQGATALSTLPVDMLAPTGNVASGEISLPPRVSLSPGSLKYVLIKATMTDQADLWFVKSESPSKCGGPYHANVAKELVEWLAALGFKAEITGGGRIMYDPSKQTAKVFGFSYGFGRGDHIKAAELISEHSDILATYDLSPGLY